MKSKFMAGALAATLGCFMTVATALPVGVYPEEVRQVCKPVEKLIIQQLKGPAKGKLWDKTYEKIVNCLGSKSAYLEKAYFEAKEKALAKVGDEDKLEEMVGMGSFAAGDFGEGEDWRDFLPYASSLALRLLTTLEIAGPAIKYPDQVIKRCKEPQEGHSPVDFCLSYKAEYMREVMDKSLKIILAHSSNPRTVEAEQKLWETWNICDPNYATDPVDEGDAENCNNLRLILRAAELERQARQLEAKTSSHAARR